MQPGSAEWWTQRRATAEKPRRPRVDGLTLDRILDAALAIVDANGLDALTVRRLADELGTSHPALYRHVGSQHEIVVLLVDRVIGPYTGRALTPLATIDLVGWDIHRAIVDNVYAQTRDEAHATLELPAYMDKLMERGVLGNKTGRGFFWKEGKVRHALDPVSGDYKPEAEVALPELGYIDDVARLQREGRYASAMQVFLSADGPQAELARKVIAGYISYVEGANPYANATILRTARNGAPDRTFRGSGVLSTSLGASSANAEFNVALEEPDGKDSPSVVATSSSPSRDTTTKASPIRASRPGVYCSRPRPVPS